jgi:DNA polymerase III epsilon subunit-like protein
LRGVRIGTSPCNATTNMRNVKVIACGAALVALTAAALRAALGRLAAAATVEVVADEAEAQVVEAEAEVVDVDDQVAEAEAEDAEADAQVAEADAQVAEAEVVEAQVVEACAVAIDVETMRLDGGGRVIQVGVVVFALSDGRRLEDYCRMIRAPTGHRWPEWSPFHAISGSDAEANGVAMCDALRACDAIVARYQPQVIVAHNKHFDYRQMHNEVCRNATVAERAGSALVDHRPWVCTLEMARRLTRQTGAPRQSHKLKDVYERIVGFSRLQPVWHDALEDADAAAQVYARLLPLLLLSEAAPSSSANRALPRQPSRCGANTCNNMPCRNLVTEGSGRCHRHR